MDMAALYLHDPAPAIQRALCTASLDLPMEAASFVAEGVVLVALAAALSWRAHRRWRPAAASSGWYLLALLVVGALVALCKAWIPAPRPLGLLGPGKVRVLLEPLRACSFPSGHSAAASAFATWSALELGSRRRWPWLLALLCGLSRVYVGAHWVTDILAGWLVGAAVTAAVLLLTPGRGARRAAATVAAPAAVDR